MRAFSVRIRLIVGFGLVLAAVAVLAVVGYVGFGTQLAASTRVRSNSVLTQRALQVKYQAADWNGWQTGYAFDIVRGVPNAASDDAESRKAFLASTDKLRAAIESLRTSSGLTGSDKQAIARANAAIDAFMATDVKIVQAYRERTAEGVKAANDLVMGDEIRNYQAATDAIESPLTAIMKRDGAATAGAENAVAATIPPAAARNSRRRRPGALTAEHLLAGCPVPPG